MRQRLLIKNYMLCAALIVLACALAVPASAANRIWWASCLTGGGSCLDGIDAADADGNGTALVDGDGAIVIMDNAGSYEQLIYRLEDYAAAPPAESSPTTITPDANAGNRRWKLTSDPVLASALALTAPLASPTFSGTVTITGIGSGLVKATGDVLSSATALSGLSYGGFGASSLLCSDDEGTAISCATDPVETKYQYFPVRYAEDDDSVTAPAAAAEISTTTMIGREFAEDADNGLVFWWQVPADYSSGIKYRIYYAIKTDADADETVVFGLSGCSIGNTDAIACTEGTAVNVADELTTDYDANEIIVTDWSSAVTVTNITAGEMAKLLLIRDVSEDDYDEASDHVFVVGIEIKYKAGVIAATSY